MTEVTVAMPMNLSAEMLREVRRNKATSVADKDEENLRIGWLLSAWDVLIEHRLASEGRLLPADVVVGARNT